MSPEIERKDIQKAMACDLLRIFEKHPDQTYTADLKERIDAYITGAQQ